MDEIAMTSLSALPRHDGVALWRKIAIAISRQIATGVLTPGARLPTEAVLAAEFGVNRHTVRRAQEELSREGLIRVEQGRGAFVPEDVLDYVVGPRTRFSEWIRRENREPSSRVLRLCEMAADRGVAKELGVKIGGKVALLDRVGFADGRPVSIGSHHFPANRLPGILEALRNAPTITEALRDVGVSHYLRQTTRVTARLPKDDEAELLEMPRNRPLLVCENVNVDRAGRVIEFGIARYPTPRVQIVFEPRHKSTP